MRSLGAARCAAPTIHSAAAFLIPAVCKPFICASEIHRNTAAELCEHSELTVLLVFRHPMDHILHKNAKRYINAISFLVAPFHNANKPDADHI